MNAKQGNFLAKFSVSGGFPNLLIIAVLLAFFALFDVPGANAQKKKTTKPPAKKKKPEPLTAPFTFPSVPNFELNSVCVPEESDYLSVLRVDKDSKLTLIVQIRDESKTLAAGKPLTALQEILSSVDKKSIVTITPSPTLDFGSVAKILYQTRQVVADCVNVEASTKNWDPFVYLLPEPNPEKENLAPMPNPLLLIVNLDKEGNITLNNEKQGSLSNLDQLKNLLARIFKERENNGVFREGKNEVEKTVFLKAAPQLKYEDVIKIIEALKDVGASPIGLQIDDL